MNEKKRERIAKVEHARQLKRLKVTTALSVTLLRAVSARSILRDEIAAAQAEGLTLAVGGTFDTGHMTAMEAIVVTRPARVVTMIALFYSSLNVVIEGWSDKNQPSPTLTDTRIDALLASKFPHLLDGFRNAMLHPSPLTDRKLVLLSKNPGMARWTDELCDEFVRFFQEWRRSITQPASAGQGA